MAFASQSFGESTILVRLARRILIQNLDVGILQPREVESFWHSAMNISGWESFNRVLDWDGRGEVVSCKVYLFSTLP